MKIYFAGSVPKGDKEAENYINWREEYFKVISSSTQNVEMMDPTAYSHLEGDSEAILGAACLQIEESDIVIVNAESHIGAGTSMEFVIAKYFNKPVITVLPKDTHHRRSNIMFNGKLISDWIHPLIDSFSDIIIENISEIDKAFLKLKENKIKDISVIDKSIEYAKNILK